MRQKKRFRHVTFDMCFDIAFVIKLIIKRISIFKVLLTSTSGQIIVITRFYFNYTDPTKCALENDLAEHQFQF